MACRHQSHWQLLISPLHKRQEIIRMDQSTRICVCLCVCVCVCVGGGGRGVLGSQEGDSASGGEEGGCGSWIAVHLHLHECVFLCVWWKGGWLTGPAHSGPLHGICWGLQMINKVPSITSHTHTHTHAHTHQKQQLSVFYRVLPIDTTSYSRAFTITNKHATCRTNDGVCTGVCVCVCLCMACKHTDYVRCDE